MHTPTADIKITAGAAAATGRASANDVILAVGADDAVRAALAAAASAQAAAADFNNTSAAVFAITCRDLWYHIRRDLEALMEHGPHHWPPLWEADFPFAREWSEIQKNYSGDQWAFWHDWYQRLLDGGPFPEDYLALLHEIATQDDAFWEGKDDVVNARISLLIELHDLRKQVDALSETLKNPPVAVASASHRAHNRPDELIETEDEETQRKVLLLRKQVDEIKQALHEKKPKPSVLKRCAKALIMAAKEVAVYCGKKADIAVSKSMEVIGETGAKWAIRVGYTYWLTQTDAAQSLGQAVLRFAEKL